ncbi:branched-chain amino acid ABC transporter permease [Thermodesulfobacteriota bacterium]
MLAQSILNGFTAGSIYILLALGLTLIMGIMGIVQMAHGEIYMMGAYVTYAFCTVLGLPFMLSLVISALIMGTVGVIIEKVFYRPFRHKPDFLPVLIVATAVMLMLQNTAIISFGATDKVVTSPFSGVITFFGVSLSLERLIAIIITIILVTALFFLLRMTKIGQAMVAISQHFNGAALQGININHISSVGMYIGCALAAVAGAIMGAIFNLSPTMGNFALMKGIAAMVLGGMGSLIGTVIGGLIIGLTEGIVSSYVNVQVANLSVFVLIILILLFRPQGIMGLPSR